MESKDFLKTCPQLYDIVGTDLIMFNLKDKTICFNKNEPIENYKSMLKLSDEIVKYIKEKKTVQVWDLNNFGKYDAIFAKKTRLFNNSQPASTAACNEMVSRKGRLTFPYLGKGLVIKTDSALADTLDGSKKVLSIDKESDFYAQVINPTVYSDISPHFILLVGKGNCHGQKWISLEASGSNLFVYLAENKNTPIQNTLYISLLIQSFSAYLYLLHKGYIHGDFKPQNVVVAPTEIPAITYYYNNITIPTYGKLIKMIDFGDVSLNKADDESRKKVVKDLERFIDMLREVEVKNDINKIVSDNLKEFFEDGIMGMATPIKMVQKIITFLDKLAKN